MNAKEAIALGVALLAGAAIPSYSCAGCKEPLPSESLRALDERIDAEPAAVLAEVKSRLDAQPQPPVLETAELYALAADAYDVQDDDEAARAAVAAGRKQLNRLPDSPSRHLLTVRLDLISADSPRSSSDMSNSVAFLTELERTLPAKSLERTCLLIVRGRLNTQLGLDEDATLDGITAYRLASELREPAATADAAYQLAMTYLRAGLLEDAAHFADESIRDYRSAHSKALLSDALYIKADVLEQMKSYGAALAALDDVRALNAELGEAIDVAFDDQKRCHVELALGRVDDAERTCVGAREVLAKAGRLDLVAAIDESLARIDLLHNQPTAALARLDALLNAGSNRLPVKLLPKLYRARAEAFDRLGRPAQALHDLKESLRLTDAADAQRHSVTAGRIKEHLAVELAEQQKSELAEQVRSVRAIAEEQVRQWRLRSALAALGSLVLLLIGYLLWNRARYERARREAAESLETQARVISTVQEAVLLLDEERRIEYANPSALRLFGRDELVGTSIEQLGVRAEGLEVEAQDSAGGVPLGACELRLVKANGAPLLVLLTRSSVTLPGRVLQVWVLQDVTELRRLEREVLAVESDERSSTSTELHEGIAQDLTAIELFLTSLGRQTHVTGSQLEAIVELINLTLKRALSLAQGLSPVQIAAGRLSAAIEHLADDLSHEQGIEVDCNCQTGRLVINPRQSDHLYHLAEDCLRFTASHPGCRKVSLRLTPTEENGLSLTVIGEGDISTDRSPADDRAWAAIAYRTRIMGGTARLARDGDSRLRTAVSLPLESFDVSEPEAAVSDKR